MFLSHIDVSVSLSLSLPFSVSLKSIDISLGEDSKNVKKKRERLSSGYSTYIQRHTFCFLFCTPEITFPAAKHPDSRVR